MKFKYPKIIEIAKGYIGKNAGSHGWDHTERVLSLALHIGSVEGANLEVIELAAILHDIGRHKETEFLGEVCHAEVGAASARDILQKEKFQDDVVEQVVHCIENHRFRGNKKPESLEAKCLFDADKLDSIGAVGIGRAFLFAGEVGAKLHNSPDTDIKKTRAYGPEDTAYREFYHKLQHVHERILTNEGKRLASERHQFMSDYFLRLEKEINGDL